MTIRRCQTGVLAVASMVALCCPTPGHAQPSQTAELAELLDRLKIDSVAAKDPATPDHFVGALYFPGLQLLVVSARYTVPSLLNDRIAKKDYREVYIDLNSASIPETKVFIEDLLADGLRSKRDENQPFDIFEQAGRRTMFDGDWKKQKLSEKEYLDIFAAADEAYAKYLRILIDQLRKAG
jgi:hypothetical protein